MGLPLKSVGVYSALAWDLDVIVIKRKGNFALLFLEALLEEESVIRVRDCGVNHKKLSRLAGISRVL